jgi:RNA polymerase sigma-70 factor (ECF subfamily)
LAVERLYLAESSKLFRYAQLLTQGDRSKAEDLVQKVFEAAATGWADVPRDDEGRRRWLFRVLRNKAIDLWREESRIVLKSEPIDGDREASSADDPCALVIGSISDEQLWKELKVMPPMQYQVAYLSWGCGWSTAEIAETLGIVAATVRVHKHNAVMQLRSMTLQNLDVAEPQDKRNPEDEQRSGDEDETGGQ